MIESLSTESVVYYLMKGDWLQGVSAERRPEITYLITTLPIGISSIISPPFPTTTVVVVPGAMTPR